MNPNERTIDQAREGLPYQVYLEPDETVATQWVGRQVAQVQTLYDALRFSVARAGLRLVVITPGRQLLLVLDGVLEGVSCVHEGADADKLEADADTPEAPFPYRRRCRCGHAQSLHAAGMGACTANPDTLAPCSCDGFRSLAGGA